MSSAATSRRKKNQKCIVDEEEQIEKLGLHERLDEHHLVKCYTAFHNMDTKQMDKKQFSKLLNDIAKITFDDQEFELLFVRINTKR